WLDDGSFLWHGEGKDGPELQHREKTGALQRVLAGPEEGFLGIVHADAKAKEVVYRASADPTQQHLFRKPIAGGKPAALSQGAGLHSAVFGKSGDVWVQTASLLGTMPASTVYHAGKPVGVLPAVAEDPPFVVKQEIVKVGNKPGFYATLIRPRNLVSGKRYPTIVHVYGGPGHQE